MGGALLQRATLDGNAAGRPLRRAGRTGTARRGYSHMVPAVSRRTPDLACARCCLLGNSSPRWLLNRRLESLLLSGTLVSLYAVFQEFDRLLRSAGARNPEFLTSLFVVGDE